MSRAAGWALGIWAVACLPCSARAQQASYGQYLLLIDDSGSMDRSDPRRLVVMASLSFAAALEDGDQVMMVGLNELASGEVAGPAFTSPRELLRGRDGEEGTRPVAGPRPTRLAQHGGGTPCRAALERARSILNAAASAGAPQTLLMLTDGACNGGAVEPAARWLGGLRSQGEGRFRFVLLVREGSARPNATLADYGRRTGWEGDARVAFDARALLRAFAQVLSFSRGLRYDEGGRPGLERTFAGARAVRILAIDDRGAERIALERVVDGDASRVLGGPTFRHALHGWSLRVAVDGPSDTPYSVRSPTPGADVLVVPVYGRLRVEGVVAPCGDAPPVPWDSERSVRAGQPACAWARLVGDTGETIHPNGSFPFQMDVCTDRACTDATAMQPAANGAFNARLGADMPLGRHERSFRAQGGALARPILQPRGFSAVAFGIHRVALAAEPQRAVDEVDLGTLPQATSADVQLILDGAFPAGARAHIRCEVEGDEATAACIECSPGAEELELQAPFELQLRVRATHFCQVVSDSERRELPVRMRAVIEPDSELPPHTIPIRAVLRYARASKVELRVQGGSRAEQAVSVPSPVSPTEIRVTVELEEGGLSAGATSSALRMQAGDDGRASVSLFAQADDCCAAGAHMATLVLTPQDGSPALRLPLRIEVADPGWWVCPGRQILKWTLVVLAVLLLLWTIRGFVTPAKFGDGAVLMWTTSHDALLGLREGDDGYRRLARFSETHRAFRRNAALWLGGPRAPLPSLKRMPADARIEAEGGGGATLIVQAPGVERFEESTGWTQLAPGRYPVSNRITLRRGEELYLRFRR